MEDIVPIGLLCVGSIFVLAVVIVLVIVLGVVVRESLATYSQHRRMEILSMTRNLYSLSPSEFEEYVGILFSSHGYRVQHTGGRGDTGIDLRLIGPGGHPAIVQCKRYSRDMKVGPDVVRALQGVMIRERVNLAFLVTTSTFTTAAYHEITSISGITIRLMDGDRIAEEATKIGLPGRVMELK
jgi:HJR/Mrr/RecB family endonuclease